jgi:hypothetical protein
MSYETLSEPWATRLSINGRRVIAWTKLCTVLLGSVKHLACGDWTNLYCCEVMTTTIDYGMAVITLDILYFVLSFPPTPQNVLSMLYGRRHVCAISSLGAGLKALWAQSLIWLPM